MTQPDASCLKKKRVLLVEDEVMIAMHYEDLLIDHGCIPIGPAPTVEKALALIATETLDAALLDGNLKGCFSTPVAEMLERRGVPVLLITGYEDVVCTDPILSRLRWLTKPVKEHVLVQAMVEEFC